MRSMRDKGLSNTWTALADWTIRSHNAGLQVPPPLTKGHSDSRQSESDETFRTLTRGLCQTKHVSSLGS